MVGTQSGFAISPTMAEPMVHNDRLTKVFVIGLAASAGAIVTMLAGVTSWFGGTILAVAPIVVVAAAAAKRHAARLRHTPEEA